VKRVLSRCKKISKIFGSQVVGRVELFYGVHRGGEAEKTHPGCARGGSREQKAGQGWWYREVGNRAACRGETVTGFRSAHDEILRRCERGEGSRKKELERGMQSTVLKRDGRGSDLKGATCVQKLQERTGGTERGGVGDMTTGGKPGWTEGGETKVCRHCEGVPDYRDKLNSQPKVGKPAQTHGRSASRHMEAKTRKNAGRHKDFPTGRAAAKGSGWKPCCMEEKKEESAVDA